MRQLNNQNGFTLMEIMVVTAILGVVAAVAILNYIPIRARACDSSAVSDARNLISAVMDATLDSEDVVYTKSGTGGAVGDVDNSGNLRAPVFTLTDGVIAEISDVSVDGFTIVDITLYHAAGSSDPASPSGKKEFTCLFDETSGMVVVPQYN